MLLARGMATAPGLSLQKTTVPQYSSVRFCTKAATSHFPLPARPAQAHAAAPQRIALLLGLGRQRHTRVQIQPAREGWHCWAATTGT